MKTIRTLAIGFAAVACLAVGPAAGQGRQDQAGDCARSTRSYNASYASGSTFKIRTVVATDTQDKAFDVTVSRNGNEKNQDIINRTKPKMTTNMEGKASNRPAIDVTVDIFRRDIAHSKTASCTYVINAQYINNPKVQTVTLTWKLPDDDANVCEDITEVCDDCEITCKKTFNNSTKRWTTTFTISD